MAFIHLCKGPPMKFLRPVLSAAILLAVSCFILDLPICSAAEIRMPERGLCAHRGANDSHPENTLEAFRAAIMQGAQMIEFDVRMTQDGHLVLMHDETLDRTTSGRGLLSEHNLDQVQKFDAGSWKGRRHRGARVPTLSQALDMMPDNVWLNVHIKGNAEVARKAAAAIVAAERSHQCVLAVDQEGARLARSVSADIKICNMERQADTAQYVEQTIASGADFIQLLNDESVTAETIARLHAAGVKVNYCCTDDAKIAKSLFQKGCDFLLTDQLKAIMLVGDELEFERLTPTYSAEDSTNKAVATFKDGEAQIVPEFADTKQWIHHDLWVETEFDSDGDGLLDRMHVSVTRQRQTDTQGLKVPVVYVSSPYFSGTAGPVRNFFWDPRQELNADPPEHEKPPVIPNQSRRVVISASHWQAWVPRGYAVVHSASPGTGLSQGCPTIGGDNESLAPKAVVDWLCGRAKGFTTPYGDRQVEAHWSTGKVGMTGTSYNGTIPLAAATTGVEGLEAIIPIAPNTSYYHYYRSNGLVRHPGGYIGEDVDVLYNFIASGPMKNREFCDANIRDREMANGFDRASGDYNDFWAGRDYLNDMEPMKAALLMAHAFNDWNVMPEHSVRIYKAAQKKGLPVQCYFHQGGHGGEPPLSMMNRWFTRYLYGVENGVENDPKAWIVRENESRQKPTSYADYPNPEAASVDLRPRNDGLSAGQLGLGGDTPAGVQTLVDQNEHLASRLAREPSSHRLLFVTPTLKEPLHVSGTARIRMRLASNKTAANVSVALVSLPWKASNAKIYDNIITRGWADPQNARSITDGKPLVPGKFYELSFDLQPDDHIVPAGQQIGLMLFSTDREFTLWPEPGTELTIDLDATSVSVPFVGGEKAFRQATNE